MASLSKILVVEDEPKLSRLLGLTLSADGHAIRLASSGEAALRACSEGLPDLVILDISLPGSLDGYEVCRRVKSFSTVPVIMLTGRTRESDKLKGFECGADDYVSKPFSCLELRARVRAILRRAASDTLAAQPAVLKIRELEIDHARQLVRVTGKEVRLTPTEYRLLHCLATNVGRVLLHEDLLTRIWGHEYRDEYQYLRNYVSNLRKKIEPDPSEPQYLLSKPGVGYYLSE